MNEIFENKDKRNFVRYFYGIEILNSTRQSFARLRRLQFYVQGKPLTENECQFFLQQIVYLQKSPVDLVYRGVSEAYVKKVLNLQNKKICRGLDEKIFVLGEKSKYYLKDLQNIRENEYRFSINDKSIAFFKYIFERLVKMFTETPKSVVAQERLNEFKQRNRQFVELYSRAVNKAIFLNRISNMNEDDKLGYRNLCLTLLHHFGDKSHMINSMLLSVTTDYKVALNFAGKPGKDGAIVLYVWSPRSEKMPIHSGFRNGWRISQNRYTLPIYTRALYPNQKEISLVGGLLPSFLLGYGYQENGVAKLSVNPAILKNQDWVWPVDGLSVDQRNFWELHEDSNYALAYMRRNGEYFDFPAGWFTNNPL